jgi:predicted ribosomally synthesized peptide with SipW-like signal peptide
MRKILIALLGVLLVAALAGAGTFAYFSDTETSTGNTFTAGTLDLVVGGGTSLPFEFENIAPGDTDTDYDGLANTGSIAAELDIAMGATANNDNGTEDPENDQNTDTGIGDLGGQLEMALWLDLDEDGDADSTDVGLKSDGTTYDPSEGLDYATVDSYSEATWDAVTTLDEAGGTNDEANIVIDWELPEDTDNRVMGDGVSYDLTFTLQQPDLD